MDDFTAAQQIIAAAQSAGLTARSPAGAYAALPRLAYWENLFPAAATSGPSPFIGDSSERIETPRTTPIYPKDLMATVFHVLGINPQQQYVDQSGRPQFLLPEGARAIGELV